MRSEGWLTQSLFWISVSEQTKDIFRDHSVKILIIFLKRMDLLWSEYNGNTASTVFYLVSQNQWTKYILANHELFTLSSFQIHRKLLKDRNINQIV